MVLCLIAMFLCLTLQGANFWARDAATPNIPAPFLASDIVWAISLLSLLFYRLCPWLTVGCGWALLLTVVFVLTPITGSFTPFGFLDQNTFAIANVFFAHVGILRGRGLNGTEGSVPHDSNKPNDV